MSLRSTIHQIRTRDHELGAVAVDPASFIQDWRDDLVALYGRMRSELSDLESDGLLAFGDMTFNVDEEQLGKYSAPGLLIEAANRTIYVAPQARLTSGGAGRLDMFRRDGPSSSDRLSVVRRVTESGALAWMVEKAAKLPPGAAALLRDPFGKARRDYEELGKASLESALDHLLSA